MIKFVIRHGRVKSQDRISVNTLDDGLLSSARDALARLPGGQLRVARSWSDGTEGVVGLGLPPSFEMPVERLSETLRETWEAGREARERKEKGTTFDVTTSGQTESYILAREAAVLEVSSPWNLSSADKAQIDLTNLAGLYGAVAGSFGSVEKRKPANERELRPSAERISTILGGCYSNRRGGASVHVRRPAEWRCCRIRRLFRNRDAVRSGCLGHKNNSSLTGAGAVALTVRRNVSPRRAAQRPAVRPLGGHPRFFQ